MLFYFVVNLTKIESSFLGDEDKELELGFLKEKENYSVMYKYFAKLDKTSFLFEYLEDAHIIFSKFNDIKEVQQVRLRADVQELRMLRQILTEGVKQGSFIDMDIEMASTIIFYSLRGLEAPYTKESIAERMQQRREYIANFILKGLK